MQCDLILLPAHGTWFAMTLGALRVPVQLSREKQEAETELVGSVRAETSKALAEAEEVGLALRRLGRDRVTGRGIFWGRATLESSRLAVCCI